VVKLLLEEGVELETKDNNGLTPLSYAAAQGHEATVKLLLEKGAELDSKDKYGRTPLSLAAEMGHEAVVNLLIAKDSVNPNSEDNIGRSPQFYVSKNGHAKLLELLLADEKVELDSKDHYGSTPLSVAVRMDAKSWTLWTLSVGLRCGGPEGMGILTFSISYLTRLKRKAYLFATATYRLN
jgi:ankyrin repeat protein